MNFRPEMRGRKLLLKSLVVILFTLVVIIYYTHTDNLSKTDFEPSFIYECPSNSSSQHKNVHHVCFGEPRIFFVETSGVSVLNSRQACAIESTAHHNPSYQVIVLMMSVKDIDFHHYLAENLQKLPNVKFYRLNIEAFTYGTPIFEWYQAGKWKNSQWKASHLSDSLRYLLMWKYGGMYLDLDIVALKSMENITNSAITENWDRFV
ncbi:lactosylceramide 4-alpha-galactosyltransferase-like isoform X1 [Uloborus diversus]|uniref:lactosylceramide 4-alpha-galactosyltransferase-like isoform X1 n=1 Tax=Uloborus diversus TaxID=327109 RepID=UPI00240A0E58|nr:lactosylceramide 4-alpha-galactosyltransferase-like isoform X1 [Uloborus diversus]